MEINYVLGTYPTLLENMVARVYENTNVDAVVDEIEIPERNSSNVPTPGGGHNHTYNVVFAGRDRVPHTLRLFTESGSLLQEFNVQPMENIVTVFDPIYFKIGDGETNTPLVGQSEYTNTDLNGVTTLQMEVFRNGTLLYPNLHVEAKPGGGFVLKSLGDIFGDEEEFMIRVAPQVVATPVNDSVVGKTFGYTTALAQTYVDVTSNINYEYAHLRKHIRISGTAQYHFTTAPPVGYTFRFCNMVSGTPTIYFDIAGLIQPGGDVATKTVPTGGIVEVYYDGTKFNLVSDNTEALGAMPYASITYTGSYSIGDVSNNQTYTITIPDQGTTSYRVAGMLRSVNSGNAVADNICIVNINARNTTNFKINVRELAGGNLQNIVFDYVIIKNN